MTGEEAKRRLLETDKRTKALFAAVRKQVGEWIEEAERAQDTIDPDRSVEQGNGVVTLDVLWAAIRLLISRLAFQVFPKHYKTILAGYVSNYLSRVGGKVAAMRIAGKIPGAGTAIQILQGGFSIPSRLGLQRVIENAIRKCGAEVRAEMNRRKLSQASRPGKVRDVRTRHYRPQLSKGFKKLKSR